MNNRKNVSTNLLLLSVCLFEFKALSSFEKRNINQKKKGTSNFFEDPFLLNVYFIGLSTTGLSGLLAKSQAITKAN